MSASDPLLGQLPRNTRIAAALLEVLGASGDVGGRARALRAAGLEAGTLRSATGWLPEATVREMFRAVSVDRRLGRRIGQALVRPEGVGLLLCYSGLATPEKAYRRSHQLLARESEGARFEVEEIAADSARVVFHPAPHSATSGRVQRPGSRVPHSADRSDEGLCGVREGMLEAVPMLFGLLPAQVHERECVAKGARRCVFDVRWRRLPRSGLWLGVGLGLLGAAAAAWALAPVWPAWGAAAAGLVVWTLGIGAGRAIDLARQLEAVAGSRRGQLALLDQADQSLAERLDSLARLGGQPAQASARMPVGEDVQGLVPVSRPRPVAAAITGNSDRPDGEGGLESVRRAAAGIREALANLRGRLADLEERLRETPAASAEDLEPFFRDCLLESRRIEEIGGELARHAGPAEGDRGRRELGPLVERVVASLQRQLGRELPIELALATDVPAVVCDAGQIEWLVEQLLRNAVDATVPAAGERPAGPGAVRVSLAVTPDGVELAIADQGDGIEAHTVDEVFDPFSAGPEGAVAGRDAPFGLAVCYRIVAEHGGELRMVSEPGRGTRVAALLPPAPRGA